jgi:multiple sugar transport system substrate-binding protein
MKNRLTHARPARFAAAAVAVAALALTAGCGSGFSSSAPRSGSATKISKTPLTLMFGSSGPAETKAVDQAAAAFTKQSGIKVNVVAASNLTQQVAQGFAGGEPPDVFYLDPSTFQNYAKQGVLDAYPATLANGGDFYPALKAAFTYNGTFTCEPKDASTLALYINTSDWAKAGLTAADVPTTWTQLATVAKKLTTKGRAGLVIDQSHSELDEFLYQNGGTVLNSSGTGVELDSSQNVAAFTFVKGMLTQGSLKFPPALSSSWSGEAFGTNKAAMTIVGNWLTGAMQADYPSVGYKAYALPTGPSGTKATLSFTNCWAVPKQSKNLAGAIDFVKFLTTPQQQMTFAETFGVLPSLQSLQSQTESKFPQLAVNLQELAYAHPDLALPSDTQALGAFDSALAQLASGNPATILKSAQTNFQALVSQSK